MVNALTAIASECGIGGDFALFKSFWFFSLNSDELGVKEKQLQRICTVFLGVL
jgi:hypothetical protein